MFYHLCSHVSIRIKIFLCLWIKLVQLAQYVSLQLFGFNWGPIRRCCVFIEFCFSFEFILHIKHNTYNCVLTIEGKIRNLPIFFKCLMVCVLNLFFLLCFIYTVIVCSAQSICKVQLRCYQNLLFYMNCV